MKTITRLSDLGVTYSMANTDVPLRRRSTPGGSDDVALVHNFPRVPAREQEPASPGELVPAAIAVVAIWIVGGSLLSAALRLLVGG